MKTVKSVTTKISVVLVLLALMIGAMAVTANAASQSVTFETKSWNSSTETLTTSSTTKTATVIDGSETALGTDGTTTYYVVSSDATTAGGVKIYGEVHIILDANYQVGTSGGSFISLDTGASLHIHKKTNGGTATLTVGSIYSEGDDEENENIYIHDGTINASRMLGSDNDATFGDLLIYGGTVNAAQIGMTCEGTGGTIGIYGGTVNAISNLSDSPPIGAEADLTAIEIYNATVKAQILNDIYTNGAVIGTRDEGSIGRIVIKNSKVTAFYSGSNRYAYVTSISSGRYGSIDSILVADSTLDLTFGNYGTGIGGAKCSSVEIRNANVKMNEENLAAKNDIAGVKAKNVKITLSTLEVEIENSSGEYVGYGILASENATVNSSMLNFSKVGTGISSEGLVTIDSSAFASGASISGASIQNSNGDQLYGNSITLSGVNKNSAISAINTNKGVYSVSGAKILTDDKTITLYLPLDTSVTSIVANGAEYSGKIVGTTEKTGTFYPKCDCSSFAGGLCTNCGSLEPAELVGGYYLIKDIADLEYFKAVVEGELKNGSAPNGKANARLMADISMGSGSRSISSNYKVSLSGTTVNGITIGNAETPFRGIFDGNGYTLYYYFYSSEAVDGYRAPFLVADGATFKNLTVDGAQIVNTRGIDGVGGIVAFVKGDEVTFENCIVKSGIKVSYPTSGKGCQGTYPIGGFVGQADAPVVIKSSAFLGTIHAEQVNGVSFMVGNSASGATVNVSDSYVYGNMHHDQSDPFSNSYICRNANDTYVTNTYAFIDLVGNISGGFGIKNQTNKDGANEFFNKNIDIDAEMIANGELTYKLNRGDPNGAWRQTLGGETPDAIPNFTGAKVAYNISAQSYDNHDHAPIYVVKTVNTTNDSLMLTCPECAAEGIYMTLIAPEGAMYDPYKKSYHEVSVTNRTASDIVYKLNGTVLDAAPVDAGSYTAEMTLGGVTASVEFDIAKYNGVPSVELVSGTTVTGESLPRDIQLVIKSTSDKTAEYRAWNAIGDYTIEITDAEFSYGKKAYSFKITPADTDNVEVVTGTIDIDVKDNIGPTAKIKIGDTDITLGDRSDGSKVYFFKVGKTVTVEASDEPRGSGMADIYYALADSHNTDHAAVAFEKIEGNSFTLPNDTTVFLIIKAVDKAGNISYVYTDGIVVYTDSKQDTESIEFVKTSTDNVTAKVILNGNTVSKIMIGSAELSTEAYSVAQDGTVTFVAEKIDEIFIEGGYTLTVHYAPRGVEYVAGEMNEAPVTTSLELTVKKAEGSVTNISDIGKEYDATAVGTPTYEALSTGALTVEYRADAEGSEFSTTAPTNAGNYIVKVTVGADENYTEAYAAAKFTITKAPLTVKAKDNTVVYGDDPADDGVEYEGLKNGETYEVLGGSLSFSYDYEALDPVGRYAITPSGYTSDNYEISYDTGALTVAKKSVDFVTQDQSIMSTQSIDSTKYTANGLLNGHLAGLANDGGSIIVDKIFDENNVDVTENYNITHTSKGVYHCFDVRYTSNGTSHWHACKVNGCGAASGTEACRGGSATCSSRAICNTCGNSYGSTNPSNHRYTTYTPDNNATSEKDGTKTATCEYGCGSTHSVTEPGSRIEVAVGGFDADSIKSNDKEELGSLIDEIDELLESDTLTENERADLENAKAVAETLVVEIENIAAAKTEAEEGVASYESESIKSSDKEDLEALIGDIDELLKTDKLTDEEKAELESAKAEAAELIADIKANGETKADAEKSVESYDSETVKSSDKESIEGLIVGIDALLATDSYTDDERAELESAKAEAEELIAAINATADRRRALDEKLSVYTADNVKKEDVESITAIIAEIDTLLADENYTAQEKAELESAQAEANGLLETIEKNRITTTVMIIVIVVVVLAGCGVAVWIFIIKKRR